MKYIKFISSDLLLKLNSSCVVQFSCSVMSNSLRPHGLQYARLPCPSPTPRVYSNSCPSISEAIQLSHPLSSPSPPTFNLAQHQGLFKQPVLHITRPKYWSFSFSISPSNEYSGVIFFRMDWLDLLAVQGALKSLPNTTVQKNQFLCSGILIFSRKLPVTSS